MHENRKEARLDATLPVTIRGIDRCGSLFSLRAIAADVTSSGARLRGVNCFLEVGATIAVQYNGTKALFRVVWVGAFGTPQQNQVGVRGAEPGKRLWNMPALLFTAEEPRATQNLRPSAVAAGD